MELLRKVAEEFYRREGVSIKELCFVFPNRRSGLFFKKYLSQIADKVLFLPSITTFKDLIITMSGKREADKIELLFDIYQAYCEVSGSGESFDDFLYWGEIILSDFDTTDKYRVNASKLFANIKEIKEIESDYSFLSPVQLSAVKSFWDGFLPEGESESKRKFRLAWETLWPLYTKFKDRLSKKEAGYEGMLYRQVAETEESYNLLSQYKSVVFVGFNALNECEREIMSRIQKDGFADFYWDYRGEILNDSNNRASLFIDRNLKQFPSKIDLNLTRESLPQTEVIGVASSVIQARVVGEILKDIEGDIETAVVLPREELLLPLLSSVPQSIERVNITMGYPLAGTPLLSLIKLLTEMEWDKRGIYHKRVIPILNHTYVRKLAPFNSETLRQKIINENIIYAPVEMFSGDDFLKTLFEKIDDGAEAPEKLCDKLEQVLEILSQSVNIGKIEKEFIYHVQKAVNQIREVIIPMSLNTFGRLLSIITEGLTIPFKGEPLSGLQIMGMLETTALDFKNVIICSVNEGSLPAKEIQNSFIPYNLRVGFGLPVKESEDAVSSYNFYRLILGAERVYLLYDTRTEGLKSGEESRFIKQLRYIYNLPLKERIVNFKVEPEVRKEIVVEKSQEIYESLINMFGEGGQKTLSASLLNTYIDCPLQFYLKAVKGVEVQEDVSEGVEADEFGSIFHLVMEGLYKPYMGETITSEIINTIIRDNEKIDSLIDSGFKKYKNISHPTGYSLLVKIMIAKYVEITLRHDQKVAPFTFIEAEKRVKEDVRISEGLVVTIKGIVDRVDTRNIYRIIDYKTGKGDLKFSDIDSLFDPSNRRRNSVAFQMFLYAALCKFGESVEIEPYFIRELAKGSSQTLTISEEQTEQFRIRLNELLEEIFNPSVSFTPAKNIEKCKWCHYNAICY